MSIISIGVDYFQILSVFAGLRVRWPLWVKQVLQVLSLFNFNIDIAGPECAFPDFDYRTKWIITVLLPAIFGAVLLLTFFMVQLVKLCKKVLHLSGKGIKYTSHGSKLLATFLLVFYFLYLAVTRRALDVFNCNPVDPDDGYLYTEFTSINCEAGLCRCDDPEELQAQLKPWAVICLIIYSFGFPLYVILITWRYRIQMKLDQLLRAHDLGDSRKTSTEEFHFVPRLCQSSSRRTYDIRKRYHQLYYHFKPGKLYWMLILLLRKFSVAFVALIFRSNIVFMLSFLLVILFLNYVATGKMRPYMSTVEREVVKENHRLKYQEALDAMDEGVTLESVSRECRLHLELHNGIEIVLNRLHEEAARTKKRKGVKNLDEVELSEVQRLTQYYFDYNTVELVLLGCSIFLSLVAIMFESGQFFITDVETGKEVIDEEASGYYNTVLVFAAFVLIGSIVYYVVVFFCEVVGRVPVCLKQIFASKKRERKVVEDLEEGVSYVENPANAGLINDQELKHAKDQEIRAKKQLSELNEAKTELARTKEEMQRAVRDMKMRAGKRALNKTSHAKTPRKARKNKSDAFRPLKVGEDE